LTTNQEEKKGIAFIEFETEDGLLKSLELNGTEIDGRRVRIEKTSTQYKSRERSNNNNNNINKKINNDKKHVIWHRRRGFT